MSVNIQPRVSFRLLGRSFLAFVIAPERPLDEWLAELDRKLSSSPNFFANRPIVLDFNGFAPSKAEAQDIVDHLEYRNLRLIAAEGVVADWLPERLAPLPGVMQPVGMFAPKEEIHVPQPVPAQEHSAKCATLLIDEPVRSGQIISYLDGDVTVVGSVASGAEIIAGGSIHVYGALRGRAFAGVYGNPGARIFCNNFDAEILVIDGLYKTADDFDRSLRGTQVQARLDHGIMNIETVN